MDNMNNMNNFDQNNMMGGAPQPQKAYVPSIVLGLLGAVGGLLIPIVGLILSIVGIVLANKNKLVAKVTPGLICSILGTVVSVGMWIYATITIMGQMDLG